MLHNTEADLLSKKLTHLRTNAGNARLQAAYFTTRNNLQCLSLYELCLHLLHSCHNADIQRSDLKQRNTQTLVFSRTMLGAYYNPFSLSSFYYSSCSEVLNGFTKDTPTL